MPDVMDELSKSPRPLVADPADEEPRRSPVRFILLGMLLLAVLVLDNQPVKAGDLLVRIDPRDYQARVDIARAAVLQAESQLHTAQTVVQIGRASCRERV